MTVTDLLLAELEALCAEKGLDAYRGRQVMTWLYGKGALGYDAMTNLPQPVRQRLASEVALVSTTVKSLAESADGTRKFLIGLADGECVETVLIPEGRRNTVCLSTQVGCAMQCAFCASGLRGLKRNLRPGEIVEQLLHVLRALRADERISNVVYMGLGEPLVNYENVLKSVRILNADWGLGIGARKITISTVGLPKPMSRLAEEGLQVNLAISLHAADDATRNRLVPPNRRIGLARVLQAARDYVAKTGREITFEYVLVEGVNCTPEAARKLARLIRPVPCNVNVIPCNPVPDIGLAPPPQAAAAAFVDTLRRAGVNVNLRKRRGDDISAACGQLRLREAQ